MWDYFIYIIYDIIHANKAVENSKKALNYNLYIKYDIYKLEIMAKYCEIPLHMAKYWLVFTYKR